MLYHDSSLKRSGMAHVNEGFNEGSHSFTHRCNKRFYVFYSCHVFYVLDVFYFLYVFKNKNVENLLSMQASLIFRMQRFLIVNW